MAPAWHGPTLSDDTLNFGPLALIAPLLQRLDIAAIIDRHLPPDPQLAFSHGRGHGIRASSIVRSMAMLELPDERHGFFASTAFQKSAAGLPLIDSSDFTERRISASRSGLKSQLRLLSGIPLSGDRSDTCV